MGIVYRARQVGLNRIVALKMILGGAHAGEEERLRFLGEAEVVAGLRHPGIVQVHDFGTCDGIPYFALEFCPGGSLEERLQGKPIPHEAAASLILRLAEAAQYAHEAGIIHRDLKPGNILLRYKSSSSAELDVQDTTAPDFWEFDPLITDFGLARRIESQAGLTLPGAVMGTPSYMPPEQARGETVGPSIDLYALGAIFYEMLTGRPPFQGSTPQETLVQVTALDPVPVCRLNPAVPQDLETVCLKCLEKEPAKRYASCRELADDLARWQRAEPIHARPVGPLGRLWRWCRRNPAVASLVGAVIGLTITALVVITVLWREAAFDRDNAIEQEKIARAAKEQAQKDRDLALKAEEHAQRDRDLANEERNRAEVLLYASQLSIAQREIERSRSPRRPGRERARLGLALNHLDACRWDLRGWEHRLLYTMLWPGQAHLRGHTAALNSLAQSPDGQFVITGSRDGTARLWSANHGICLHTFKCPGVVRSVALTARHAIAGTENGHVLVWDVKTGKPLASVLAHPEAVAGLATTPNGNLLLTAGSDQLQVRELPSCRAVHQFADLEDNMTCVAVSPDGKLVAAGQESGAVLMWELATRKPRRTLAAGPRQVGQVAFSPDGRLIATAGGDRCVRLWDAGTGEQKRALYGHGSNVSSVAFSPDGTQLLSASYDDTVRVWGLATGQALQEMEMVARGVQAAHWGLDGRVIWCGGGDGVLRAVQVWDRAPRRHRHPSDVSAVAWGPEGQLASANWDGEVRVGQVVLTGHEKVVVTSLAWSGGRLYSGGADNRIREWDVAGHKAVRVLEGHKASASETSPRISGLAALPKGGLASCSGDDVVGVVCLWGQTGTRPIRQFVADKGNLAAVACSPDGSLVAAAGSAGTIFVWSIQTGKLLRQLKGHTEAVSCLAFSPDGRSLASGGADHAVAIWPVGGGKPRVLEGHTLPVNCVAWCPDGSRLLSAGEDGHINVWEPTAGLRLLSVPAHGATVSCLAVRGDGVLASGGYDQTVRTWDARLGLSSLRPHRHPEALVDVRGEEGAGVGTDKAGRGVAWNGVTGQALPNGAARPRRGRQGLEAVLTPLGEPLVIDQALARSNQEQARRRLKVLCRPALFWHLGRAGEAIQQKQWWAVGAHVRRVAWGLQPDLCALYDLSAPWWAQRLLVF
jgi:WD40 repeat protein